MTCVLPWMNGTLSSGVGKRYAIEEFPFSLRVKLGHKAAMDMAWFKYINFSYQIIISLYHYVEMIIFNPAMRRWYLMFIF